MRISFTFTKRLVRLELLVRMNQMLVQPHQTNRKTLLGIANLRCVSVPTTTNTCLNQSKNARHIRKVAPTKLKSCTGTPSVKESTLSWRTNWRRSSRTAKISIKSCTVIIMGPKFKTCLSFATSIAWTNLSSKVLQGSLRHRTSRWTTKRNTSTGLETQKTNQRTCCSKKKSFKMSCSNNLKTDPCQILTISLSSKMVRSSLGSELLNEQVTATTTGLITTSKITSLWSSSLICLT